MLDVRYDGTPVDIDRKVQMMGIFEGGGRGCNCSVYSIVLRWCEQIPGDYILYAGA